MSLIARMRLRSTLIKSASPGNLSASRSSAEIPRPCKITRPSEVRKIDEASLSSLSFQISSTRKFTAIVLHAALFRRRGMRCGGLLLAMEPIDDAAGLHTASVGVDIDLRRVRAQADHALLRREHRDVFEERGLDLLEYPLGHFRVVRLEIVRLRPEIMRRGLGLRRDGVEIAH